MIASLATGSCIKCTHSVVLYVPCRVRHVEFKGSKQCHWINFYIGNADLLRT